MEIQRRTLEQPTPKQLFDLAKHGVILAKEQEKLRNASASKKARFFMPEEIDGVIAHEEDQTETRQKIAGRIGRAGYRLWSMRLIDSLWVLQPNEEWRGVRNVYKFEWTDKVTTMAEKIVRSVPTGDPLELADEIDRFFVNDDVSDIWHAEMQIQQVNSGDVELLERDIVEFGELSRTIGRAA